MDVRMPDGTILKGIPEGTSKEDVLAKYNAMQPKEGILSRAITNIPASGGKFIEDMTQIIRHPIETAKSFGDLALGIISKVHPLYQHDEAAVDAVTDFYQNRYGSIENAKETFANDPVGFAGDVSMLFTGGGAAGIRGAGKLGTIESAMIKGGRAIDPINLAAKAGAGATRLAGRGAANLLGVTTGVGTTPITQAYKAGRAGGSMQDILTQQMRGGADNLAPTIMAKEALEKLNRQKGAAYRSGMSGVKSAGGAIDFTKIDDAFNAVLDDYLVKTDKGKYFKGPKELEAKFNAMKDLIDTWKKDPELHTAINVDALKQAIDEFWVPGKEGIPVTKIRNAIKSEIVRQVPDYAKVMDDYEARLGNITAIEKELSLGRKANPATTMRKLLAGTRDNVSANFGARADIIKKLDPNLMPALSGQALGTWTPRGIQRLAGGGTLAAGTAGLVSPYSLIPTLASQSPRLAGEAALKAGQFGRRFEPLKAVPLGATMRYSRPFAEPYREGLFGRGN